MYANPYSEIGWWGVICITPVWLFLSSSITHKSLSSDSYLSLLPNQSINICNNCDYGNLWLYNHRIQAVIGSSFYFDWLETVRSSHCLGCTLLWWKPGFGHSERESTGFVKTVITFQKHFTKSILPEAFCFAGDLSRETFPGSISLAGTCLQNCSPEAFSQAEKIIYVIIQVF